MKEDEKLLLEKLRERADNQYPLPGEIARQMGMDYNRLKYLLSVKWEKKGWWSWGVSWETGWLDDA